RVDAVRVHVVHEPAAAPDPGHEHHPVRRGPQLRPERLDRGEDGVVAAPGTPPDLLVGGEVFLGQGERVAGAVPVARGHLSVAVAHRSNSWAIASSTSWACSGWPWTFESDRASTRNRARISMASWPRFISGMST